MSSRLFAANSPVVTEAARERLEPGVNRKVFVVVAAAIRRVRTEVTDETLVSEHVRLADVGVVISNEKLGRLCIGVEMRVCRGNVLENRHRRTYISPCHA